MTSRVEIDGKFYRHRRGKLVEIPPEWVGKVPTERTMRHRPSKWIGKLRRADRYRPGGKSVRYLDSKAEMIVTEG